MSCTECPECGGRTEVEHTRTLPAYVRRRRKCRRCGHRSTTYEVPAEVFEALEQGAEALATAARAAEQAIAVADGMSRAVEHLGPALRITSPRRMREAKHT